MKKSIRELINEEKSKTIESIVFIPNKSELDRISNTFVYPESETMFLLKISFYMGKAKKSPGYFKEWINKLVKKTK